MRGDLLHFVQRTLNRYINESSVAQDTLESLNGNSMCIEVKDFGLLINLTANDGQLVVAMPDSVDATVTICGTVLNLFSLLGSIWNSIVCGNPLHLSSFLNSEIQRCFGGEYSVISATIS